MYKLLGINMLDRWKNLINSISIIGNLSEEVLQPSELASFEETLKMTFPEEYKEFCQIFGTGRFQEAFSFYSPSASLILSQEQLDLIIESISNFPSNFPQDDLKKIELLRNLFVFGDDYGSYIFAWDMRTYSSDDKSYDIYLVLWDSPSETFDQECKFLGRSFFDLIDKTILTGEINNIYHDPISIEYPKRCFKRYIYS